MTCVWILETCLGLEQEFTEAEDLPRRLEPWLICASMILGRMKLSSEHGPPRENSIANQATSR
jgi:hypothetical protein